jgi:dTDP-3-amino-3,4,6-trideoxy-alpha-D-glucose transaminase
MSTRVPFHDVQDQNRPLREEFHRALDRVIDAGEYQLGAELTALQTDCAERIGVRYAIGVQSGTAALVLALRALRVGPGDDVVTPANMDISVPAAPRLAGAALRFADVSLDTHTLDAGALAAAITPRTRAVIVPHAYGFVADLDAIEAVCRPRGVAIVEDACLAFGARHGDRTVGSIGVAGCFSFGPYKPVGGLANGGLVTTNDAEIYRLARMMRGYGRLDPERVASPAEREALRFEEEGQNVKMDNLTAAFLRVKLARADAWAARKRAIGAAYASGLRDAGVGLPRVLPGTEPVPWKFPIRVTNRARVRAELEARGVQAGLLYIPPMHRQPAYAREGFDASHLPATDRLGDETLCLPVNPTMSEEDVLRVCVAVRESVDTAAGHVA